jgi:hypothetical protein
MRHPYGIVALAGALVVGVLIGPTVFAGQGPTVYSIAEAQDPGGGGPVITLSGKGLSRFKTFELFTPAGAPSGYSLSLVRKTGSSVVLSVPGAVPPGAYLLTATDKNGLGTNYAITIRNGKPLPGSVEDGTLSPALRTDLDDAETLGGNGPGYYTDAGNLTGTLDPARYSAYADLQAEGKVGTGAGQLAAGDHNHDGRYALLGHTHPEYLTIADAATTYAPIDHNHDAVYAKKALVGAKVYLTADVVGSGSVQGFQWQAEEFDTDSMHDNQSNPEVLRCRSAGYYLVHARLMAQAVIQNGNIKRTVTRHAHHGTSRLLVAVALRAGRRSGPAANDLGVADVGASEACVDDLDGISRPVDVSGYTPRTWDKGAYEYNP